MKTTYSLSSAQIDFFHENGYLGPFVLCSPDEMAEHRGRIEREVLPTRGPNPNQPLQCRHLDHRLVYELCTHPASIDRMASLYGEDLVMWASYFFSKPPGGVEIPWHQDLNYWPLEPVVNLSTWLAIDPAKKENACVRIIPGSHKKMIPHIKSPSGMAFGEMADPTAFDAAKAIDMELEPGEFFMFNEKLLHQSNVNSSGKRRIGLTTRVTLPFVRITHDRSPLFPGHKAIVIRGQDRLQFNRLGTPPEPLALETQGAKCQ